MIVFVAAAEKPTVYAIGAEKGTLSGKQLPNTAKPPVMAAAEIERTT